VLVLDAGDALIKDRSPATTSQGASSVEAMNMMGYDAAVLGEGDLAQLGVDAVRQRIAQAEFPFLSANVYLSGQDERLVEPYHILEVGTRRVALIGITGPAEVSGLEIRDPVEATKDAVVEIGAQAEILILLSHTGLELNRQIAAQVPTLDLIISGGGPQMTYMAEGGDGAPLIVHADVSVTAHAGRRIGVGTFAFDAEGVLQGHGWQAIPLDSQIPDDPALSAWEASHR
jgi:2',3'-cyclic-nucleotide 2'-phosphodiesterase (5'-nucleotidase family)